MYSKNLRRKIARRDFRLDKSTSALGRVETFLLSRSGSQGLGEHAVARPTWARFITSESQSVLPASRYFTFRECSWRIGNLLPADPKEDP